MDLRHTFFNGTPRPGWAGPVSSESRTRRRGGITNRSIQVTGVVLPVNAPKGRPGAAATHNHTFGKGLGFPDLGEHLLDPANNEEMSKRWADVEKVIAEAAAGLMGWGGKKDPREANVSDLPSFALHLAMSGEVPAKPSNSHVHPATGRPGGNPRPSPSDAVVRGDLSKLVPIRDKSGTRFRLQQVGSPASFTLTPFISGFSRDPRSL